MPQITFHTATIFKYSFYCHKPVCNGRRDSCNGRKGAGVLLTKRASSVGATTNFNHFCSSSPSTFSFSEEQAPLEHYGEAEMKWFNIISIMVLNCGCGYGVNLNIVEKKAAAIAVPMPLQGILKALYCNRNLEL